MERRGSSGKPNKSLGMTKLLRRGSSPQPKDRGSVCKWRPPRKTKEILSDDTSVAATDQVPSGRIDRTRSPDIEALLDEFCGCSSGKALGQGQTDDEPKRIDDTSSSGVSIGLRRSKRLKKDEDMTISSSTGFTTEVYSSGYNGSDSPKNNPLDTSHDAIQVVDLEPN